MVGMVFHVFAGVAHGYAYAGKLEHFHVVASIAEGHGLFATDAEVVHNFLHADGFGTVAGYEVGEGGMPTGHPQAGQQLEHLGIFVGRLDDNELAHLLSEHSAEWPHVGQLEVDLRSQLLQRRVGAIEADGVGHEGEGGDVVLVGIA